MPEVPLVQIHDALPHQALLNDQNVAVDRARFCPRRGPGAQPAVDRDARRRGYLLGRGVREVHRAAARLHPPRGLEARDRPRGGRGPDPLVRAQVLREHVRAEPVIEWDGHDGGLRALPRREQRSAIDCGKRLGAAGAGQRTCLRDAGEERTGLAAIMASDRCSISSCSMGVKSGEALSATKWCGARRCRVRRARTRKGKERRSRRSRTGR
ncbi:hypothetical protein B0H17DRAFT_107303 [Mycena rosella]|uniref:Uncharacterized protein n=1 Tax=Mycena rosella TaxID=1033263 RepID=A0AAD7D7Z8_MYCRO|nr:hypothetical protein B0H17DRAFT_107303 [Mycena rosella]